MKIDRISLFDTNTDYKKEMHFSQRIEMISHDNETFNIDFDIIGTDNRKILRLDLNDIIKIVEKHYSNYDFRNSIKYIINHLKKLIDADKNNYRINLWFEMNTKRFYIKGKEV